MIAEMLALVIAAPLPMLPEVVAVDQEEPLQHPLAGADYLLIAEAARHPRMRGANLSCYRIHVHNEQGARWVSFLAAQERVMERETEKGTEIIFLPTNPRCRSISFEMNRKGRVARVISTRH
jgi:hypothetical protein